MKFQILKDVPVAKLASRIKPGFNYLLPAPLSNDERFTLIVFRAKRNERESGVVLSATVKQAIVRLGEVGSQRVLALAGDFTLEARKLLKEKQIEAIGIAFFGWTDETYKNIRAMMSR